MTGRDIRVPTTTNAQPALHIAHGTLINVALGTCGAKWGWPVGAF